MGKVKTKYNSALGDWYPMQSFNYIYILNPCFCNRLRLKTAKLFWYLKSNLNINGVGMLHFPGSKTENIFRVEILGKRKIENKSLNIFHKCRYKDCLLK